MKKFIKHLFYIAILVLSVQVFAGAKINTDFDITPDKKTRVKVTNQTNKKLICYVAIDGHKSFFKLSSNAKSRWYKAVDSRYNYKHFSIWCDYLSMYPKYQ